MTRTRKAYKGLPMEGWIASWYDRSTRRDTRRFRAAADTVVARVPQGSRVLEVAPGPGYLSIEIAKRGAYQLTGLDISRSFVRIAGENAARAGVSIDFRQGDGAHMPFPDGSFDCVLSLNTIHNFPRPRAVVAMHEIQRVSNGRAFVQVDSYLTPEQKEIFESWVLTAEFHDYPDGWLKVFADSGYTGDYDWTIID